jgi:putative DNA primase/helicase
MSKQVANLSEERARRTARRGGGGAGGAGEPIVLNANDPMTIAERLIAACYTAETGASTLISDGDQFFRYSGGCYEDLRPGLAKARIWKFLKGASRMHAGGTRPFMPTGRIVADVLQAMLATTAAAVAPPAWLDAESRREMGPPSEYLVVRNGILRTTRGELLPHTPSLFTIGRSEGLFDPDATAPRWERFLEEVFAGDRRSIDTLAEVFGYVLSGETKQEKAFVVYGPRRSGKSTLASVLGYLLGEGRVCGPSWNSLDASKFGLEPFLGRALAVIGDAQPGGKRSDPAAAVEALLTITGRDVVSIPRKYTSAWTGRLGARIMILTNNVQPLMDLHPVLASRFVMLPCQVSFYGREDPDLRERLMAEAAGVLNWSLDGLRRLRERGHFLPALPPRQGRLDQADEAAPD